MLSALSLLSVASIQGLMADEVQDLRSADLQDLRDIAEHYNVPLPETTGPASGEEFLQFGALNDLDEDSTLILQIARKRVIALLDKLIEPKEPWETASDVLITVAVNEAVGRLDTPAERQAAWNRVIQVWDQIGDAVRDRRQRREAKRASRGN